MQTHGWLCARNGWLRACNVYKWILRLGTDRRTKHARLNICSLWLNTMLFRVSKHLVVLGRDVMAGGASLDQGRGRERMRSTCTACWHMEGCGRRTLAFAVTNFRIPQFCQVLQVGWFLDERESCGNQEMSG